MNESTTAQKLSREERRQLNKQVLWGPIQQEKLANFTVNEVAKAFYLLAVLKVVFGILFAWPYILEGIVIAVVAFVLQKTKSRIAAGVLILIGALSIASTLMSIVTQNGGGVNLVIAILITWFSIRALQATMFLASKKTI